MLFCSLPVLYKERYICFIFLGIEKGKAKQQQLNKENIIQSATIEKTVEWCVVFFAINVKHIQIK